MRREEKYERKSLSIYAIINDYKEEEGKMYSLLFVTTTTTLAVSLYICPYIVI
jgi:hypothetical protein